MKKHFYSTPTVHQINRFLRAHNMSGSVAAMIARLSGGRQVRRYTTGTPQALPFVVWWTWHAYIGLNSADFKLIHKLAMSGVRVSPNTGYSVWFALFAARKLPVKTIDRIDAMCKESLR